MHRVLTVLLLLCFACGSGTTKKDPTPIKDDPKTTLPDTTQNKPDNPPKVPSLPMPEIGTTAPPVKLKNQKGEDVDLASFAGKSVVVLYFYPKDDSPNCTIEANDFQKRSPEIEALGAKIFGVSVDPVDSHQAFADKFDLTFDILSDADQQVSKAYGVLSQFNDTIVAKRTTFIIGKDGKIKKIFQDVQVNVHGEEVIKALKEGV